MEKQSIIFVEALFMILESFSSFVGAEIELKLRVIMGVISVRRIVRLKRAKERFCLKLLHCSSF